MRTPKSPPKPVADRSSAAFQDICHQVLQPIVVVRPPEKQISNLSAVVFDDPYDVPEPWEYQTLRLALAHLADPWRVASLRLPDELAHTCTIGSPLRTVSDPNQAADAITAENCHRTIIETDEA